MNSSDFGKDFIWGAATASYQIEGAWNTDGKGVSIWDVFSHTKGKIKNGHTGDVSCDFYHRYPADLDLLKSLGFKHFRFSLAWTRLFPHGIGSKNQAGIDFYHRLIDACLQRGIEPWVTLYHWDLPQALQAQGGWENRAIIDWFGQYADFATRTYGDRVKYWMIFNEPTSFVCLGYLIGIHAPGKRGLGSFFRATHHANLTMAEAGRITKSNCPRAEVGTTFFTADVQAYRPVLKDQKAAARLDVILNRLYLEPSLGLGYPIDDFEALRKIEKYFKAGDDQKIKHTFDFIGLQNYSREVVKYALFPPVIWAKRMTPEKRAVNPENITKMGWEVYPEGIYHLLTRFARYPNVKKIYITENGASFHDILIDNRVPDEKRIRFLEGYLEQVLRAKQEGVPVKGYFVWSLMDNFEWAEGFEQRFGLIYVDFPTQKRVVKDSGKWFKAFLER